MLLNAVINLLIHADVLVNWAIIIIHKTLSLQWSFIDIVSSYVFILKCESITQLINGFNIMSHIMSHIKFHLTPKTIFSFIHVPWNNIATTIVYFNKDKVHWNKIAFDLILGWIFCCTYFYLVWVFARHQFNYNLKNVIWICLGKITTETS